MGQIQSQLTNMLSSVAHMARLAKVESTVKQQGKEQKERLEGIKKSIKQTGNPAQFMAQAMNPDNATNGAQQSSSSSQATIDNKVQQKERIKKRINQITGGGDNGSEND